MPRIAYDEIADAYAAIVAAALLDPTSVLGVATRCLLATVGPVTDLDVCDLGCGEGHLARSRSDAAGWWVLTCPRACSRWRGHGLRIRPSSSSATTRNA